MRPHRGICLFGYNQVQSVKCVESVELQICNHKIVTWYLSPCASIILGEMKQVDFPDQMGKVSTTSAYHSINLDFLDQDFKCIISAGLARYTIDFHVRASSQQRFS